MAISVGTFNVFLTLTEELNGYVTNKKLLKVYENINHIAPEYIVSLPINTFNRMNENLRSKKENILEYGNSFENMFGNICSVI